MSGTNYDANTLPSVMDSGLIFISCLDGVSHNLKEHAKAENIEKDANVLLGTVIELMK